MSRDNHDSTRRREQLAEQTKAYLDRGGRVDRVEPGRSGRVDMDKHNTFLFAGRRR